MNVLLVEDDELLGKSLQQGFKEKEYECCWLKSGDGALAHAASGEFNVVVLDLMLPEMSGLEVLAKFRRRGLTVPVLI
ncbi:MAG: response regulator [Pirellulaceae bacterium]